MKDDLDREELLAALVNYLRRLPSVNLCWYLFVETFGSRNIGSIATGKFTFGTSKIYANDNTWCDPVLLLQKKSIYFSRLSLHRSFIHCSFWIRCNLYFLCPLFVIRTSYAHFTKNRNFRSSFECPSYLCLSVPALYPVAHLLVRPGQRDDRRVGAGSRVRSPELFWERVRQQCSGHNLPLPAAGSLPLLAHHTWQAPQQYRLLRERRGVRACHSKPMGSRGPSVCHTNIIWLTL